jgi:hypothetical protein
MKLQKDHWKAARQLRPLRFLAFLEKGIDRIIRQVLAGGKQNAVKQDIIVHRNERSLFKDVQLTEETHQLCIWQWRAFARDIVIRVVGSHPVARSVSRRERLRQYFRIKGKRNPGVQRIEDLLIGNQNAFSAASGVACKVVPVFLGLCDFQWPDHVLESKSAAQNHILSQAGKGPTKVRLSREDPGAGAGLQELKDELLLAYQRWDAGTRSQDKSDLLSQGGANHGPRLRSPSQVN